MEFPIKNAVDTIAYIALAVHLPDNFPSPDEERTYHNLLSLDGRGLR